MLPIVDPWLLELIVVAGRHTGAERVALSRDVERGLLLRLRKGVYVERSAFEALSPEAQHVVRMRAVAAVTQGAVVFSHVSAAVLHGLPVLRERLQTVHVVVDDRAARGRLGVCAHLLPLDDGDVELVRGLRVTSAARTTADQAASFPFEEGVMAADALLRSGVPRRFLEEAVEALGGRRGAMRAADVAAFAHPGAESAAESRSRTTLFRLGVEPPVLQHRLVLLDGSEVFLDALFPSVRVGGEVDGARKLLDPAVSRDARLALVREKRREDAVRLQLRGLARWGWVESGSPSRPGAVLRAVGVLPAPLRPMLSDYAAAARSARPRSMQR